MDLGLARRTEDNRMEVGVIFEPAFQGTAGSAVWIVDSPDNRKWFTTRSDLDGQSAVFFPEGGEVGPAAILRAIWNVQEHYPDWSQIGVRGVNLTAELVVALRGEGTTKEIEGGFALTIG
jgi:hypothetical protein